MLNDWPPATSVAPCARPLNVPVTASEPSLLIIVKVCPVGVVKPGLTLSAALPRLTVPVTFV